MSLIAWLFVGYLLLNAFAAILLIGHDREPITPGGEASVFAFSGIFIGAIVLIELAT